MLIQFTVGNFKSFKEKATLSLEATHDDSHEEDNIATIGERRLLKSAAIYGPNAGGKSNFLGAMGRFREMIENSSKETQKGEPIPVVPFLLNETTESAPTFFEAVFLHEGARYRYGFEATQQMIRSEWLFRQNNSIRETCLFTRENDEIKSTESFKEGKGLETRTRSNALFLSVAAQFNGEVAGNILDWVNGFRLVLGSFPAGYMDFTSQHLGDSYYGPLIRALINQADVGIEDLRREEIAKGEVATRIPKNISPAFREYLMQATEGGFEVKTFHKKFNSRGKPVGLVEFNMKSDESTGTQKFAALAGPFLNILREGGGAVLVVDELEAQLHPMLTGAIVSLFNSSANRNNAQLIFATHDTGLLDPHRIRRDQIWFVEKDRFGASRLYSLDEFKGVRKEAKFAKEYLLGQFGAVPRLGDFQGVLSRGEK